MTYNDIYNWALQKMKEEENGVKWSSLLKCPESIFVSNAYKSNYAERELVMECCPNASSIPMNEMDLFNIEELIKLKGSIKGIKSSLEVLKEDILKLRDEYKDYYNHYANMIKAGKQGILSWFDLDNDRFFQYDTMLYHFNNLQNKTESILKDMDHD